MNLDEIDIHKELKKHFGFNQFKGLQEQVIKSVIGQDNTFVIMPTGGGKSLCYQLPALINEGTAIVVSPLIALMKNQVDAIRSLSSENGIAHVLNSSLTKTEITQVKKDISTGITKLLYVAPESLTKEEYVDFLQNVKISFVAIDEAHCISEWGHDFRPEYRNLKSIIKLIGDVPVIGLTATATPKVQEDILKNLDMSDAKTFKASFNRPNLFYEVRTKTKNIEGDIIRFIKQNKGKSGIIYCLSRKKVEEIAEVLQVNGVSAVPYHAGLDAKTRAKHQDMFLMEDVEVVVATIAFGMGIDKPDVRFVIHHDIPKSLESYYQETGRAGRDGLPSEALLFYSPGDAFKLQRFAQVEGNPGQSRIMLKKLDDMVKYCQLQSCRRQYLMQYFGEAFPPQCGNCDVCLTEYKKFDGTVIAQKALSAVARLNQRFGTNYVIDLLRGSRSEKIREEHKQLKTFGIGRDLSKAEWQRYIGQLVIQGLLEVTDDAYPILQLTPASEAVLKGLQKVEFNLAENVETAPEAEAVVYEAGLLQDLKTVRFNLAMNEDVPAYIILSDATLLEMATYLPQNIEELSQISGFGEIKLNRYGEAFLQPTIAYCKQHGLSSRMSSKKGKPVRVKPIRTSANNTQRESFDLFKSGISINEIAGMRKLAPTTIEGHLCSFITTGEIEVTEFVAEQKIPAITDAANSYGAERLAPLKEVLGDDYSYTEIRAVLSWMKRPNN